MLVALERYPHAVQMCCSAIESALKAALKISPESRRGFIPLFEEAREKYGQFTTLKKTTVEEFKNLRNCIEHQGYIPKDDKESATQLLKTGYVLMMDIYRALFKTHLTGADGILIVKIGNQLDLALRVYREKYAADPNSEKATCLHAFAHSVRYLLQANFISSIDFEEIENDNFTRFNKKIASKENLYGIFHEYCELNCPICGSVGDLVAKVDSEKLNSREVCIEKAFCVNCNFVLSASAKYLANEVCKDEIQKNKMKILKGYGIES